ncbi:VOC family protein [Rickettsiales bacterium LUAb2]
MIKKIAFVMYPVTNMDRARNFYENVLELKANSIYGEGSWVEYDLPEGGCLALTNMAQGVTPASDKGGSLAFEVENLDILLAKLKEQNITIKVDTMAFPVCKMAVILDTEGNAITLHQLNKK